MQIMDFWKINEMNTCPVPLSVPILSLKSTEFILNGFHFKTTLHWPQMYGYNIINGMEFYKSIYTSNEKGHRFSIVQDLMPYIFWWLKNKTIRFMSQCSGEFRFQQFSGTLEVPKLFYPNTEWFSILYDQTSPNGLISRVWNEYRFLSNNIVSIR